MLRSTKEITRYALHARDGQIGHCQDFLFDDDHWAVRYMVADTGTWLPERKVLVSPISLGEADWASKGLPVDLTVEQIEKSPPLESDAPVSRHYETEWFRSLAYYPYWAGPGVWAGGRVPGHLAEAEREKDKEWEPEPQSGNGHLRSTNEVRGYTIEAKDGEIGHVEDFIVNDESWVLQYLVIDTRNWLPGRKVLVAPSWIKSIDWKARKVSVDLSRNEIQESPEFDPSQPINRKQEAALYDYYGRPKYW